MPKKGHVPIRVTAVMRSSQYDNLEFRLDLDLLHHQAQTAEQAFQFVARMLTIPGEYEITCRRGQSELLSRKHSVRQE